jgi:hypothetical protein
MRTRQRNQDALVGWPTLIALAFLVAAFMVLSLLVTATGTGRFATSMGYDTTVGYVVGAIFDIAKGILPLGVLALRTRRALGTAALLGVAWICLLAFSCLATHATVTSAISVIERTGTWKMEVRRNTKAELTTIEQQLATLSSPAPPRPAKTVQEALAGERVPPSVWQDSQECSRLHESAYFAKACGQVVQLRRELAAAQDYERLASRAAELRKGLAEAPIVSTSDPLPAAFSATLGRVLPLGGTEGVALLLTMVVEIMSSFGLAGVAALYRARAGQEGSAKSAEGSLIAEQREETRRSPRQPSLPRPQTHALPGRPSLKASRPDALYLPEPSRKALARPLPNASLAAVPIGPETLPDPPSLRAGIAGGQTLPEPSPTPTVARCRREVSGHTSRAPSNVLPWTPTTAQGGSSHVTVAVASHVPLFVQQRLQRAKGVSIAAKDLRAHYEAWCAATQVHEPLSLPRFAAELKALGCGKWKSSGLMRYRDLQLVTSRHETREIGPAADRQFAIEWKRLHLSD